MSISKFFEEILRAKLNVIRSSWGAIDQVNNRVFLRVWKDQIDSRDGVKRVQIYWKTHKTSKAARNERAKHIEAIKAGAQGFGVVCWAKDVHPDGPRSIAGYDESTLLVLGRFTEDEKHIYASIEGGISTSDLANVKKKGDNLAFDIKEILSSKPPGSTTQETLVNARLGQGPFRLDVLRLWDNKCAVTGSSTVEAVNASHIKPWCDCTDAERLDPRNGLPLVANLHALFDAGLIAFTKAGLMLVSSKMNNREKIIYGIEGKQLRKTPGPATVEYLEYHLANIFRE